MKKLVYFTAAAALLSGLAACDRGGLDTDDLTARDQRFMRIADRFVNNTVIPTYTSLSDYTEQLVSDLEALKARPARPSLPHVHTGRRARLSSGARPLISVSTLT